MEMICCDVGGSRNPNFLPMSGSWFCFQTLTCVLPRLILVAVGISPLSSALNSTCLLFSFDEYLYSLAIPVLVHSFSAICCSFLQKLLLRFKCKLTVKT